jgi:hypothetical protein
MVDVRVGGVSVLRAVVREPVLGKVFQFSVSTSDEAQSVAGRLASGTTKLEVEPIE